MQRDLPHDKNNPAHVACCPQCQTELFAEVYATADADQRVWLDERAAIREFEGGATRAEAERGAVEDWRRNQ